MKLKRLEQQQSVFQTKSTVSLDNANTPVRIGNKLRVTNVHSLPEFGNEGGVDTLDPYQVAELLIQQEVLVNPNTSEKIGFCRIRNIDEHSTGGITYTCLILKC